MEDLANKLISEVTRIAEGYMCNVCECVDGCTKDASSCRDLLKMNTAMEESIREIVQEAHI